MSHQDTATVGDDGRRSLEASDKEAIAALVAILDACEDGEKGYREAAEEVGDRGYQLIFSHYADERAAFGEVIAEFATALGATPLRNGSMRGALHRRWLEAKADIANGSPKAVLKECRRGEDAALETYRAALRTNLPPSVREVVQEQYEAVKKAREAVAALVDSAES